MSHRVNGPAPNAAPHQAADDRWLALDGTFNLRDAGGYPTRAGCRIRRCVLYRADSLHQLTDLAQQAFHQFGLRTIIDLRGEAEAGLWPNVFRASPIIAYHHVPLPNQHLLHAATPPPLDEVYQAILEQGQPALRRILTLLARPDAWPVLVHCTAGKDRTGVVIALLLGLAGASEETIIADYALTAHALTTAQFEAARLAAAERGFVWATSAALLACRPEAMRAMLAALERSGGIEPYVRRLGLDELQISQIRTALVEPLVERGAFVADPISSLS